MRQSLSGILAFTTVYETRSFTSAALRLNATQPGVSHNVRTLESQLGVTLFERDHAQVFPTPAAETYYRRCIEVLRALDAAERSMAPFADKAAAHLKIGLSPAFARTTLAATLTGFVEVFPNTRVTLEEAASEPLLGRIQQGDLDFAIVPNLTSWSGVKSSFLAAIPEVLISALSSGRTPMAPVVLAEQPPMKLVLPPDDFVSRAVFERYFLDHDVKVERVLSPNAPGMTEALVAESNWCGIQPAILFRPTGEHRTLIINPIVAPSITFEWLVVESPRRNMTAVAEKFVDYMRVDLMERLRTWKPFFFKKAEENHLDDDKLPASIIRTDTVL